MQEVEGLTVAAIDLLIGGIEAQGGRVAKAWWRKKDCFGCALGSIGLRPFGDRRDLFWVSEQARSQAISVGLSFRDGDQSFSAQLPITIVADIVSEQNTRIAEEVYHDYPFGIVDDKFFYKTGSLMLAWLRAQRALKCSDWVPPVKEIVRKREAVLA